MEVCLAYCHGHLNLNIFCISQNWIVPVQALGAPKRPWHLRTLMSPLINFFLESQNTGEVNDSSTGGTSCCHFLSGLVFHHFHIKVFPMSLAAMKIRNWQILLFFKKTFCELSQILCIASSRGGKLLHAGSAHLGRDPVLVAGQQDWSLPRHTAYVTAHRSQQLAATHSRTLESSMPPWSSRASSRWNDLAKSHSFSLPSFYPSDTVIIPTTHSHEQDS